MDPTLVTAAIENVLEAAPDQRTLTALYVQDLSLSLPSSLSFWLSQTHTEYLTLDYIKIKFGHCIIIKNILPLIWLLIKQN